MLFHLIATLVVALAACLLLWFVFRYLGRTMPRYLLPMLAAGVAIGYGIYAEYSWKGRTQQALPESFQILQQGEERTALAPWTWVVPHVVRLSAIDSSAIRHHPAHPAMRLVEVFLLERFYPTRRVLQLVDCGDERRADIIDEVAFGSDSMPAAINWQDVSSDDPLLVAACEQTVKST